MNYYEISITGTLADATSTSTYDVVVAFPFIEYLFYFSVFCLGFFLFFKFISLWRGY